MTEADIEEYRQLIGGFIQMYGYTSTSQEKDTALKFAWENPTSGHQKVIFKIKWDDPYVHYFLNAGAFDQEKEVLLMDGTDLIVEGIEDVEDTMSVIRNCVDGLQIKNKESLNKLMQDLYGEALTMETV